jgi:hypothetical protein
MTLPARKRVRTQRDGRRRRGLAWTFALAVLAVVFFLGLALGRALEQAPRPGGERTQVRTLAPTTITPVATVTVTVSNP